MLRKRRAAGPASVGLVAAAMLLAACGPVEVDVPSMSAAEAEVCDAFAADLPDTMAEQKRVDIEPSDAPAAAYGDPAIVVRCGVAAPQGFNLASSCDTANGVGYFIPPEQVDEQGSAVTVTTAGYEPRVEAQIPADYRPNGVAAVMAVLAPLVKRHLKLVEPCH